METKIEITSKNYEQEILDLIKYCEKLFEYDELYSEDENMVFKKIKEPIIIELPPNNNDDELLDNKLDEIYLKNFNRKFKPATEKIYEYGILSSSVGSNHYGYDICILKENDYCFRIYRIIENDLKKELLDDGKDYDILTKEILKEYVPTIDELIADLIEEIKTRKYIEYNSLITDNKLVPFHEYSDRIFDFNLLISNIEFLFKDNDIL